MENFNIAQLRAGQDRSRVKYLEFLRKPSLSVGLYTLPAGATDPQQPHTEDEVYYVVSGRGHVTVGDESRPVESGDVVFVAAGVLHHFHSIMGDLTLLVFFAPAERSAVSSEQ